MAKSVKREGFIGRSEIMEEVFRLVERVAAARSTVLITGESGTGKELVAKAIHEASPRSEQPFVVVNCSNIPLELLESELFGHTKGAFTGAVAAKKGLFEVADTGSIFLDEIGDLRPETQVRLLRVIQEREFPPLGDTTPVKVDVRIIAATNVDLKEAVKNGTFREDLYYRLSVVPVELPPLRERRENILPLTKHFIRKYAEENGRTIAETVSPDVLSLLENYNYPGNVRELEIVIERAVVIAPTDELTVDCLRAEVRDPQLSIDKVRGTEGTSAFLDIARGVNFYDEVKRFEIDLIRRALDQTGGHQSSALTFHASFDAGFDADFSRGGKACQIKKGKELVACVPNEEVKLSAEGRFGGCLYFPKKGVTRPQFSGVDVLGYNDTSWSATVSVWLRLTPDEDLEPGYCDPVHIVGDDGKKGFIFLEWSKDETPRFFRFAIRPLFDIWNPTNVQWGDIPVEKRPMVQVAKAPFRRDAWTHVVFTLDKVNDKEKESERHGNEAHVAIMLQHG